MKKINRFYWILWVVTLVGGISASVLEAMEMISKNLSNDISAALLIICIVGMCAVFHAKVRWWRAHNESYKDKSNGE